VLGCLNKDLDHLKGVVVLGPFHKMQDKLKAVVGIDQLEADVGSLLKSLRFDRCESC